jgi:hypothetical protein
MDDDAIAKAVQRAQALTRDQEEPFRSIAFEVILGALLRHGSSNLEATSNGVPQPRPDPLPPTLNEFLAARQPKSHVDRAIAIAYFALKSGDEAGVTVDDLFNAYTRARTAKPKNVHDVIAQCVRKGFLVECARKETAKAWVITSRGEGYVENDFQL